MNADTTANLRDTLSLEEANAFYARLAEIVEEFRFGRALFVCLLAHRIHLQIVESDPAIGAGLMELALSNLHGMKKQ